MLTSEFDRDMEHNELSEATRKAYKRAVNILIAWCTSKALDVAEITADYAYQFSQHLKIERKQKAKTRAHYIAACRAYGDFLVSKKIYIKNPFRDIGIPQQQSVPPGQLDDDQIELMMAQAFLNKSERGPRDLAMICMLAGVGPRASAITRMLKTDLRPVEITLPVTCVRCGQHILSGPLVGRGKTVKATELMLKEKGSKSWPIVLPETAHFYLELYLRNRTLGAGSNILFPIRRKGKIQPIDRHGIGQMIRRYAKAAGIPGKISPHSFRHNFITHVLDHGVPVSTVQQWVGHAAVQTTINYRARSLRSYVQAGISLEKNPLAGLKTPLDKLFKR
jgi:integrase/recombinase XerD